MNALRITLSLLLLPLVAACQPGTTDAAETAAGSDVSVAKCVLEPVGESGVSGTLRFEEGDGGVRITGRVEGLEPGAHGFHVHEYGDLSDRQAGSTAGDHFAPEGDPHGRPTADARHAGDLGNIEAGEDGVATVDVIDDVIALSGATSIVGRALVVHADEDRFVQPSGGAGDRVAFGVIGIAKPASEQ